MPQHDPIDLPVFPPEEHVFAPHCEFITAPTLIELRGPSGKLYGMLDPSTGVITFKRGSGRGESIDLTPYLKASKGEK